jgi:hypothetical protein
MNSCCFVPGSLLASFCLLAVGAGARVVTEFSVGINPAALQTCTKPGPDNNLWFTEYYGYRIERMTAPLPPNRAAEPR